MRIKITAAVLLLVLVISILTGCGAAKGLAVNADNDEKNAWLNRTYAVTAEDAKVTDAEMKKAKQWLTDYLLDSQKSGKIGFDFTVGDQQFSEMVDSWTLAVETTADTDVKTDYVLHYTKDGQPLKVTVCATLYKQYPIVEYTPWIENVGVENSRTIREFYGLAQTFAQGKNTDALQVMRWSGSLSSIDSFAPELRTVSVGKVMEMSGTAGKPSHSSMPMFNVSWADQKAKYGVDGIFFSCGWPGQWISEIANHGDGFSVKFRQQDLNSYLMPGEKVRAPLTTLLFWEQDMMRAQNIWRRWVYGVAMPQPNGKPIQTIVAGNTATWTALTATATTENQLNAIAHWKELGLEIDAWQMDAGWYPIASSANGGWWGTGSWYPDPSRFDGGTLKPIADALDEQGVDLILWYEPERMVRSSDWAKQFKGTDWVLELPGSECYLLNLSSDEVTDYLIATILRSMEENGVDVYRQDFNLNGADGVLNYWREADEEGRRGMTENKYLINYLRFYDAILAAYPESFIDNCASGGMRLDLETMKRSAPLWRDDVCYDPISTQSHSYGINFVVPFSGQGFNERDMSIFQYSSRSHMLCFDIIPINLQSEVVSSDLVLNLQQVIREYRTYAPMMTKDYYPLSPYSVKSDAWMAWQFHDSQTNTGMIQVFRRENAKQTQQTYYLSGLEPDMTYTIRDIDAAVVKRATGEELMCNGWKVNVAGTDQAKIYIYDAK